MAKLIPSRLGPETPDSERRAYGLFRDKLPDDWTVLHSQRYLLPRNRQSREGELDFLVLDPSRGAIGLEVKGGRVARTADGWYSVDRHDRLHGIKDPGKQASGAVHALARYWEESPTFGGRGFRCPYWWGVVLSDTECLGDFGPGLPRDLIVDASDLRQQPRAALDRLFRRLPEQKTPLRGGWVKPLVATLRERQPPASSLAVQFRDEREILLRLTEQQMVILDSLAAHHRAAIEGAAGTGKTVLAMEKARRLALAGQRVLLLCFNEPLAQELGAQAEGFAVETFHGFQQRLARRAGVSGTDLSRLTPEEQRPIYEEESPLVLLEALERLPDERYDAIVVDEAQDFLPDWWPCLDEALRLGSEGTLYAFYDPNQLIYEGGPPRALEVLEHRLVANCRNTKRIAAYAAGLVEAEARVRESAPEGKPVKEIPCTTDAEVAAAVVEWLDRLVLREDVPPEEIAIVSTRRLENTPFGRDRRAGRFALVNLDEREATAGTGPRKRAVVFDTLYRFKGLEADVVVLLDLPGGRREVTANHRYVAASRARNLLIVVRREP